MHVCCETEQPACEKGSDHCANTDNKPCQKDHRGCCQEKFSYLKVKDTFNPVSQPEWKAQLLAFILPVITPAQFMPRSLPAEPNWLSGGLPPPIPVDITLSVQAFLL